jgi:hypothetical protein
LSPIEGISRQQILRVAGMRDPNDLLPEPEFVAVPQSATADASNKPFGWQAEKHSDADNDGPNDAAFDPAQEILRNEDERRALDRGEIDAASKPSRQLISRPTPPRRFRSRVGHGVILIIVVLMPAVTSTLIIQRLTPFGDITANSGRDIVLPRPEANENYPGAPQIERPDGSVRSEPRLMLQQNHSYAAADTMPLGIQVSDDAVGLAVEVSGLPTGMTISLGRPMGVGRWRILAADVGDAMIHPPPGFTGVVDFAVELRLVDDTVVDRGSFRLEWNPTVAPVSIESASERANLDDSANNAMAGAVSTQQNASERAARPGPDHEQIELLIERSQKLLTEGEVGAARALLQHAGEAGDARAALALGGTYDPIILAILQARGVAADVSSARDWYKKASDLGSQEAQERLRLLASARLNGEAPPAVGRVEVSRRGDPGSAAKDKGTAAALSKPKSSTVQRTIHEQMSPSDPNGVYVDGHRVGADPDPKIRGQLLRDDAGRQLQMDGAGRQFLADPAKPTTTGP